MLLSRVCRCFPIVLLAVAIAMPAMGQEKAKKRAAKARPVNPALVPAPEQAGLPRVLLIGDSISMGYILPVRELLTGKANVQRPTVNCGPSSRGVESLDAWLGDKPWDVIHFNFGLHDIVYFAADGKTRVDPQTEGARHQVPAEQYEKNLREIVTRLKKTNAKLIWCSTTPVPAGAAGRVPGDEVKYNEIAARIMKEHNIAVDDLYAFAQPRLSEIQLPKNVHFTPAGSKVLAQQVSRSITAVLPRAGG